jgi:hypothetical protein
MLRLARPFLRLRGRCLLGGAGLIAKVARWGGWRGGSPRRNWFGGRDRVAARVAATGVDSWRVALSDRVRIARREPAIGVFHRGDFEGRGIVGLAVRRLRLGTREDGVNLVRQDGLGAVTRLVGDRRRGSRGGYDNPFLLIVRLRRDRRSGGASRNREDARGKQDAKTTRPDRLRREHANQPILPADRAVGMKAKPIVVTALRLVDVPDYHRTPPPRCRFAVVMSSRVS